MEKLLERWARFVTRWPLLIIAIWIALTLAAWIFGPSIDSVSAHQNTSSLPASAPSVQANHLYLTKFADGQQSVNRETNLLVITDPQGINAHDLAQASQIRSWLSAPATRPAQLLDVQGPGGAAPAIFFESRDQKALRLILTWDTSGDKLDNSIKTVTTYLAHQQAARGGLVGLTGNTPIWNDTNSTIFSTGIDAIFGYAVSLLIILVILGFVYRALLAVLAPLITVGMALMLSIPIIAWCGQHLGLAVASFSLEYVAFVLLGAGTNYGVFMLSRYKEEIRRQPVAGKEARRAALIRTVARIGESITSSALTVVVAVSIMGLAQLYTLRVTGPAIAIGVISLLAAGLSLLPAMMTISGKALFWPLPPRPATLSDDTATTRGFWSRAGRLVIEHPRLVTLVTLIVLLPLAISAVRIEPSFDDLRSLPATAPSVQAFNAYNIHFKDSAQVKVLVSVPGHNLSQPQYLQSLNTLTAALGRVQHVTSVISPTNTPAQLAPGQFFAMDGSVVSLTALMDVEPASLEARQTVGALQTRAEQSLPGTTLSGAKVLISGQSAEVYDEARQFTGDFTLVVFLISIAILLILALLVRSLIAPFYLLGTIALSALTAMGLTNLVYNVFLGQPIFSIVPIFAFVFLVSLGEDFNILTIARIREEVQKLGHRRGIATAIALTGGVVSSCGLVMAASFSRLISNAVIEVAELGFTVVIGILIDTFIVRPFLVPALATLLGRWNWLWPGSELFKRSTNNPAPLPERPPEEVPVS